MPSPALEIGLFAVMVAGGVTPIYASPRRSSYHLLNSAAFAAFAILGPDAFRLVLASASASALLLLGSASTAAGGRLRRHLHPDGLRPATTLARLGLDVVFLGLALLAAWGVHLALARGGFPLPLARFSDLLAFMACSATFSSAMAVLIEGYHHFFSAPVPEASAVPRELAFLPSDAPLYRLMLVSGSSLQILAQFLYLSYGVGALLFALGWFALAIRVHAALLEERQRLHRAFRELEASQRALAVNELGGRIVHQTRHQLGLIGISTHLIREGLESARPDRAKILEQLGRLDGVASALRRMLSEALESPRGGDEGEAPSAPPAPPRALAVRETVYEEVERLRGKAEQLGVQLILEPGAPGLVHRADADPEPLGQGVFNVVENALAAARGVVRVRLEEAAGEVIVVVEDDGPGMPAEILRRAGDPFVTTREDGSGIGLFLAAAAAKRWGGRLAFENRPEGGLRVRFHLPAAGRNPPAPQR